MLTDYPSIYSRHWPLVVDVLPKRTPLSQPVCILASHIHSHKGFQLVVTSIKFGINMNILEYRVYPTFLIFIFGLLVLIRGVKAIITKSSFSVSKHTDPRFWYKPQLIKGKEAVSGGIWDIVLGIFFMLPFIAICFGLTNVTQAP